MFETKAELADLQRLLDASFERTGEQLTSMFNASHRLSARQLSGFQGVRLVAVATINSEGEPRAAPRSAAFLHGRFGLAANTRSPMVRRLSRKPAVGVTYFENRLLIIGHGTAVPFLKGSSGFETLGPEWEKAFRGGANALDGVDLLIRVEAANMLAFAASPERYPEAWKRSLARRG